MRSILSPLRPARVRTSSARHGADAVNAAQIRRTVAWFVTSTAAVIGLSAAMMSAEAQTPASPTHTSGTDTRTTGMTGTATSAATSPIGAWKTIDDSTHEPRALIRIYADADGTLSGKITKLLDKDANPEKRCDKCSGDRKDQLVQGLRIIEKMRANGETWDQGTILDPENGKVYRAKMTLTDGGKQLVVRGYIGISLLGRSQTWYREDSAAN